MSTSWILIGGTGQEFGLTASTLALLGLVPAPERVILIDADAEGEQYRDLAATLDIIRFRRFSGANVPEALVRVAPLEPVEGSLEHTLEGAFPRDRHLKALYAKSRRILDTRGGFKAEPQLGSASFFKPSFDTTSDFRRTLQSLQNAQGHVVTVVASVAGGTGSGLWQLVTRLCRQLLPNAEIRLLLLGPLLSVQDSSELDADEIALTDHRLDANAAAGFKVALQTAQLTQRPFDVLYLLGYPTDLARPRAPQTRTDRRPSRMPLVAATVLTHTPPGGGDGEAVYLFGDDTTARGKSSVRFRTRTAGPTGVDVEVPLEEIALLAAQALRRMEQMASADLTQARSFFGSRGVGDVIKGVFDASETSIATWASELHERLATSAAMLRRFITWAADPADTYPAQVEPELSANKARALQRVKSWQEAVDSAGDDATDCANRDYHVRRWVCAIGRAHLGTGPGAQLPLDTSPRWVVPVETVQRADLGWCRVGAADVHAQFVPRAESFATPFAQAYWNTQNLQLLKPTEKQTLHIKKTEGEAAALWMGLVGGFISVEWLRVPPLDPMRGAETISVGDVSAFIEDGQFAKDAQGWSRLPFLKLDRDVGAWSAGWLVGAIHPLSGPFLGPDHRNLAGLITEALADRSPVVMGLLAHWHGQLVEVLEQAGGRTREPAWLRTIPHIVPPVDPATVWSGAIELQLDWPLPTLASLPMLGATPRMLQLVNREDGTTIRCPSVVPAYSLEGIQSQFLGLPGAAHLEYAVPQRAGEGGGLVYGPLAGRQGPVTVVAELEDVANWNIEVFPGDTAPVEWREFGLAIEPADYDDYAAYDISVWVQDGADLRRVPVETTAAGTWRPHSWLSGRPRLLQLLRRSDGVVGVFPLLGPPPNGRADYDPEDKPRVALDLGTSRSFVAVACKDRFVGAPMPYPCKVVARAESAQNYALGGYTHWHPLRHLTDGGGLAGLDYSKGTLKNARVMMLPSTLVRREDARIAGPFSDYSIPGSRDAPPLKTYSRHTDLKWSRDREALAQYLTFLLLSAVADLDSALNPPPRAVSLRLSFPLAFTFVDRGRLQDAVLAATKRVKEITKVDFVISYLDESMAGLYHVNLPGKHWKLSIDIGGGTADFALLHGKEAVATDSVRLGGDLVMRRAARRRYPGTDDDALQIAMNKLRQELSSAHSFAGYFEHRAPPGSRPLLALVEEYAARLVAGVFVQVARGSRPPAMSDDAFAMVSESLSSDGETRIEVGIFLFGGGWRLGEMVHSIEWSKAFDDQVKASVGAPVESSANALLEAASVSPRVQVEVHHSQLHTMGGEKAAVALGLLHSHVEGLLQPAIPKVQGIQTVNGIDEIFEGEQRHWHEWVGAKVAWRQANTAVHGVAASTLQPTPTFTAQVLQDDQWSLDSLLSTGASELSMALTPVRDNAYYNRDDLRQRLRSALGLVFEKLCARRIEDA